MSKELCVGERLDVRIEKIVPRGFGLGFAGRTPIFVSLAAAGDLVRVVVSRVKGNAVFAEIEEVLELSPDRIAPPCEYFGSCGGCDLQQMNYAAQLEAKRAIIADCLRRIAKLDPIPEIEMIGCPEPFGYRLRAQWHADAGRGMIGYFKRNSRDLIDVRSCPVIVPELQQEMSRLRDSLHRIDPKQTNIQIDSACGLGGEVSSFSAELLEPTKEVWLDAAGERFAFSARTFFQGNRFQIERLVATAIGDESGSLALDLYSGVGLFTLPLARRFERVIGVEDNRFAVEFANRNAETAGLGNVEFVAEPVRRFLAESDLAGVDLVLLDPPRAGTEADTIMNLIALNPRVVSYVSCEPSVLARDLKRFVENGYRIEKITAIDLFPQTHHVETVARLISPSA